MKACFCPNCGNGTFVIYKNDLLHVFIMCTACHYDEDFLIGIENDTLLKKDPKN